SLRQRPMPSYAGSARQRNLDNPVPESPATTRVTSTFKGLVFNLTGQIGNLSYVLVRLRYACHTLRLKFTDRRRPSDRPRVAAEWDKACRSGGFPRRDDRGRRRGRCPGLATGPFRR